MTLCPIAVVAGCAKCPALKICPLKGMIGDHQATPPASGAKDSKGSKPQSKS